MNRIVSLFGIAFVLLALGSEAHALQKYQYRTRGNQASYSAYSYTDCGYESIQVWVFEEKASGNQTSYDSAYVDFSSYDFCTGTYSYGYGEISNASFEMQRLQSASLEATGMMYMERCSYGGGGGGGVDGGVGGAGGAAGMAGAGGMGGDGDGDGDGDGYEPCTYSNAPLALSIDWTGTGDTYRDRSTQTYSSPNTRYRYTSSGQSREASVSGVFEIDGEVLDLDEGYGSLSVSSSGYFEMYR